MEGRNTYQPHQLLEAGASRAFIQYYETAKSHGIDTNAVRHVEFHDLEWVSDSPHTGGSFFTELWNGDTEKARLRADKTNKDLLLKAGIR